MPRNNKKIGKFIVIDGIDGSGKATQIKVLIKKLKEKGFKVATIDFPQYSKKSAGLVEEYLNGKYGSSQDLGAYIPSVFYACDRFDAGFKIKKWLDAGKIVVSDRYTSSNIGHQGGKIKNKRERKKFLKWLYCFEFDFLGIPKPDFSFILKIKPEISLMNTGNIKDKAKKAKKKSYLGNKKQDIHETDLSHLYQSLDSYLTVSKEFPEDFKVINCIKNNKMMSVEEIHQKIWKHIQKFL